MVKTKINVVATLGILSLLASPIAHAGYIQAQTSVTGLGLGSEDANRSRNVIYTDYPSLEVVETTVDNAVLVSTEFGGDWIATAPISQQSYETINGATTSALSRAEINGYSGESSLYAQAQSSNYRAVGFASSQLTTSLLFETLSEPTQFYIDLNLEGSVIATGRAFSRFYKNYDVWIRGNQQTVEQVDRLWEFQSIQSVSETERYFIDIAPGANRIDLNLNEGLVAWAGEWGAGEVFADFSSTSWLNFGFTSDIAYTIDEPALFSTPRANLVSPVPEPSAIALSLAGACVVLFAARRQKGHATKQSIAAES